MGGAGKTAVRDPFNSVFRGFLPRGVRGATGLTTARFRCVCPAVAILTLNTLERIHLLLIGEVFSDFGDGGQASLGG
jgi:hypothetical protein